MIPIEQRRHEFNGKRHSGCKLNTAKKLESWRHSRFVILVQRLAPRGVAIIGRAHERTVVTPIQDDLIALTRI